MDKKIYWILGILAILIILAFIGVRIKESFIINEGKDITQTPQLYIYGALVEINELDEDFSGPEQNKYGRLTELKIIQEIKDCEKVSEEKVIINAFLRIEGNYDLEIGKKYLFSFGKPNEDEKWRLRRINENFGFCSSQHKYDLIVDRRIEGTKTSCEGKEPGCVPAIMEEDILLNDSGTTYLEIDLINKQDNEISYSIKDLKILEVIGGFEIPEETNEIRVCSITSLDDENIIEPQETKTLSFIIDCNLPEKVICEKCELEYQLAGKITFKDELGFEQEVHGNILKYNLKSNKITKETPDYPKATEEEVPIE